MLISQDCYTITAVPWQHWVLSQLLRQLPLLRAHVRLKTERV